jgi:hypothetical protein
MSAPASVSKRKLVTEAGLSSTYPRPFVPLPFTPTGSKNVSTGRAAAQSKLADDSEQWKVEVKSLRKEIERMRYKCILLASNDYRPQIDCPADEGL